MTECHQVSHLTCVIFLTSSISPQKAFKNIFNRGCGTFESLEEENKKNRHKRHDKFQKN